MVDPSVDFSQNELNLIHDRDFLLSKIEITKKVELLLGLVERQLHSAISQYSWPQDILLKSGKISRGENYLGLPYQILDYPRRFDKQNVFAFRTMFWWGNFFSATLHLSGFYLDQNRSALIDASNTIRETPVYLCINTTPWEYQFERNNYLPAGSMSRQDLHHLLSTRSFIKLSYRWDLSTYQILPQQVTQVFHEMLHWLQVPG